MKKIFLVIATLMSLSIFYGCEELSNNEKANLIEVGFNCFAPSVSFDEIPLTRSDSDNSIYYIQIYKNGVPYCYGIVNELSNHTVLMENGETYSMDIGFYPNMQGQYKLANKSLTDGLVYSTKQEYYPGGSWYYSTSGSTHSFIPTIKYFVDDFKYTVSPDNNTINVELSPWIFALSINVNSMTEGTVSIRSINLGSCDIPEFNITPDNPHYEEIYTFEKENDAPEFKIIYTDDRGIESLLHSGSIPIARLKRTIININLKDTTKEIEPTFSISYDENYTITDGEKIELNQN